MRRVESQPKIVSRPRRDGRAHVGASRDHRELDGDQFNEWRASITRFAAITEPHVYARNDS